MDDGRSAFIRIFDDSALALPRGPNAEGVEGPFTPRFDRFFDNKENIDPLRRFASGEDGATDDKGDDDDDKKPGISGRKNGFKFGLGSCSKKSKSPLPDNYPRIPFQDITDILDPDTGLYIGEQGATPAPNPQVVMNTSGKRKAGAMNIELTVEERQHTGKRQQLRKLASRRDGDLRKFR